MLIRLWINTKCKRTSQQRPLRSSHVPSRCLDLIHRGIQHQPSNNPCDISQPRKPINGWCFNVFQISTVWSHSSVICVAAPQAPQGEPAAGAKGTSRTSKTTCPCLRWSASDAKNQGVAPVAPVVSANCWGTPKLQKMVEMIMDFGITRGISWNWLILKQLFSW